MIYLSSVLLLCYICVSERLTICTRLTKVLQAYILLYFSSCRRILKTLSNHDRKASFRMTTLELFLPESDYHCDRQHTAAAPGAAITRTILPGDATLQSASAHTCVSGALPCKGPWREDSSDKGGLFELLRVRSRLESLLRPPLKDSPGRLEQLMVSAPIRWISSLLQDLHHLFLSCRSRILAVLDEQAPKR